MRSDGGGRAGGLVAPLRYLALQLLDHASMQRQGVVLPNVEDVPEEVGLADEAPRLIEIRGDTDSAVIRRCDLPEADAARSRQHGPCVHDRAGAEPTPVAHVGALEHD